MERRLRASAGGNGVGGVDKTLGSVFSRLKPYCVDLLDLLQSPKKSASFLTDMADFLRRAPPEGLQPCLDYTMFPLLLLLDAAVNCRAGEKARAGSGGGGLGMGDVPLRGQWISDSVAEGVLMCLEELLGKCHLGSVNQMVVVMKKLTSGALLSPSEAAEEFRGGIIRCFRAMLCRIQPCSTRSCSCKQIPSLLTIISSLQVQHNVPLNDHQEAEECLTAFLQSQNASAAVGHWLSLLLQIAETEVARGHRGSAHLRKEAFLTVRVLVAKVGTADALAFFLPGVVSRYSKALYISRSPISGAAGSTGSMEHAIHGLTEFLTIVLSDESNRYALEMSINNITGLSPDKIESTQSVLQALRHLPITSQNQSENLAQNSVDQSLATVSYKVDVMGKNNGDSGVRTLCVHRTREWLENTSEHVDKPLSATFPNLSVHPSEKVRHALADGIRRLLSNCSQVLTRSKLMLLECLFVLICDDSVAVSVAAQESLESLFRTGEKFLKEYEVSELFTSLIERLPRVVLGSEEAVAISHVRRLLALMYYAGPERVVDHLLHSPIKATHFLEFVGLSLSHNSQFAGSINKLISSKPLSVGYLLSVAELKAGSLLSDTNHGFEGVTPAIAPKISVLKDKDLQNTFRNVHNDYEFPHMPPWFINIGSQKLYLALAGILRLSGLSIMAGQQCDVSLSALIDILLDSFHKLISELRSKEYHKEGWQTWYSRSGSGQLLRQTSSAVCMLNEIIYGLSDKSIKLYSKLFGKNGSEVEDTRQIECPSGCDQDQHIGIYDESAWKVRQGKDARDHIIHCVGSILHEYMSPEVWDLPTDLSSPLLERDAEEDLPLYFFRDVAMLHQVIIEGIGVFSMVLGKDFIHSGFMHSTLYLLLQSLICSNSQIRNTSDAVLRVLSTSSGCATVGHLVVSNADYIIDSLCRQLRHLDINPHVPDVFAAMLSYIGAAQEILPLLEEPMRAVSSELEVLGRHQHPHLTIPFLKAVNEIIKASKTEAYKLCNEAELFYAHVNTKVLEMQSEKATPLDTLKSGSASDYSSIDKLQLEDLDELLLKLNEMRRYRRIVGSLVESCLKTAFPLLSLLKESACLVALDIAEDVTISLAKVEEAYKWEKETKVAIERGMQLCSDSDLLDTVDAADEEADENRLLPAMNKVWPYLILCIKNKISLAVIKRCTIVLSRVVQISGGDFFIRRFHTDGPTILKILTTSPFRRKPMSLKDEGPILLPYRSSLSTKDPLAEVSSQKIQAAVLNMIAELSLNKRSASALATVLKKVSGLVVGIACSSATGLRDASIRALSGLARIDPDLIWLLLADVYYSMKKKDMPPPPISDLPEMLDLLPPPTTPKEYLYVQYGGESSGFDVDFSSVEIVFHKMQSEVFS